MKNDTLLANCLYLIETEISNGASKEDLKALYRSCLIMHDEGIKKDERLASGLCLASDYDDFIRTCRGYDPNNEESVKCNVLEVMRGEERLGYSVIVENNKVKYYLNKPLIKECGFASVKANSETLLYIDADEEKAKQYIAEVLKVRTKKEVECRNFDSLFLRAMLTPKKLKMFREVL